MSGENTATVLLTDRAWPDDTVERAVLAAAGRRATRATPRFRAAGPAGS